MDHKKHAHKHKHKHANDGHGAGGAHREAKPEAAPGIEGEPVNTIDLGANEEYAAELSPADPSLSNADKAERGIPDNWMNARTLGMMAMGSSILSFFLLPLFLGSLGMLLGFMAFSDGRKALGGWAIALGLISFVSKLAFVPFLF
ncbi:hypothetical protein [Paenibacillus sp. FJAT-26967]|uniref:hypothetical protein n=1 Tax=Paenibacillus sp. FJAT-26967 TaxID=1729690 RepID=UPI000839453D|nr:hypothetical protein [Paenibacillus sp. FJAT-26967]